MSLGIDRLVEIHHNDLPILKNMYTPSENVCCRTHIANETINTHIRWLEQDPNANTYIKFYCLNGDFSDGTFIVINRLRAYADTLNKSFRNLHRLLQLIDYSKDYVFWGIRSGFLLLFKDALAKANAKIAQEYTSLLYHLPKEVAVNFNTEREGIELRPITEPHDIAKINSLWSHRSNYTSAYIQQLSRFNLNVGAFKNDGTLVAWIFRLPDGFIGILQTDAEWYSHGFGSLVVKAVAKKVAEMGQDIYATINEKNYASQSLFEKLGATELGCIHCIVTENARNVDTKFTHIANR